MELPLVSIIVVSYNHSQFLVECLDSIKNQSYTNWELIVADDASPDNSVEVIKKWLSENNITAKTNFHIKNTGLATTLNECVEMCDGKYVKMLAADDYLHPENFEKCVGKLVELGEDYGMVFTDTFKVNNQSAVLKENFDHYLIKEFNPKEFQKKLIKKNRIAALTVMMKSSALQETGFYDQDILIEDYDRWLRINQKYFSAYIPEKLSYYRFHESNISSVKKNLVDEQDLILKIRFSKEENKNWLNYLIRDYYFENPKILSKNVINAYNAFPHKNKVLYFSIKNKLPILLFKGLSKVLN